MVPSEYLMKGCICVITLFIPFFGKRETIVDEMLISGDQGCVEDLASEIISKL